MDNQMQQRQMLWGIPSPYKYYEYVSQEDILSFIEASTEDDCFSSSECLHNLIMSVTRFKPLPLLDQLEWTTQLIDVLRKLLVRGAVPTWIPEGCDKSALFAFLQEFPILAFQKPLALELKTLLPFFLTKKCINHRESKGTLLHALLYQLHQFIGNNADLCKIFKEILSVVASPANIEAIDLKGRTPLHLFTKNLFKCEIKRLPYILPLFDCLQSPKNVNMKNNKGITPLHLLAMGLSKCDMKAKSGLRGLGKAYIPQFFYLLKNPDNVIMEDNEAITPQHLLAIGLFKFGIETLSHLMPLFYRLKTPENVNMKDNLGRTPLHLLAIGLSKCDIETLPFILSTFDYHITSEQGILEGVRALLHLLTVQLSKCDIETPPNLLPLFDLLKTPENVNMKDEEGRTPLHLLAKGLFEDNIRISEPYSLITLLLTPQNVNCEDNHHSMTPYSWILLGKEKWKNYSGMQTLFMEIEKKFMENGSDAEKARTGIPVFIPRLIEKEFESKESGWMKTTEKRLESLLGCLEAVANLELHNYRLHLDIKAIHNLNIINNTRWIDIVMKIMRVISKNKTLAQDVWDSLMRYTEFVESGQLIMMGRLLEGKQAYRYSFHIMEMLSICAEAGAQPTTDIQLLYFFKGFEVFYRHSEWAEPYLKILISSNREKHGHSHGLNFLMRFYRVPPKLVQLARDLVHSMYNTWDECVKSKDLINCFLFITQEQEVLNDGVIETFNCDNWMRRNFLHLAVIFLESLELLSREIIEKYIEARDVHGCTPLHLAYLHSNNHAVTFLMGYVNANSTDHFGLTPENIESSIGDTIEETYYEDCCKVLEAKEKVMELLKPMIVMPEDETKALSNELKILFERLISITEFKEAKIQIAGSMRERMKSGILDEADIQIRLNKELVGPVDNKGEKIALMQNLSFALINALPNISWEGIYLRPIYVLGPWKFIREGCNRGMQISLDVVLILISDEMSKNIINYQHKKIQGAPLHKQMEFTTLELWNVDKDFNETMFAPEWDIIDSLPMPCRLAIVISKALVQAYDCVRGNNILGVKKPITSYTIKTSLFFLLADHDDNTESTLNVALMKAKETKPKTEKLQFNPNAKWANAEDLQEHREEARGWAQCIFIVIKFLAQRCRELTSFWDSGSQEVRYGQAEYTLALCDCALEKLEEDAF